MTSSEAAATAHAALSGDRETPERRPRSPAPGSDDAFAAGCVCPRMDNGYGAGYLGGVKGDDGQPIFVMRTDCPLHGDDGQPELCSHCKRPVADADCPFDTCPAGIEF